MESTFIQDIAGLAAFIAISLGLIFGAILLFATAAASSGRGF